MTTPVDDVTYLPSPDFTCVEPECLCIAGIRPYRRRTFLLAEASLGTKLLIHNYGHGGAGITMSWGCAAEIRDMVSARRRPGRGNEVAVLGAGVMGLTAATLLEEAGYAVTIYAKAFDWTTSHVAGGQWAPSIVEHDETDAGVARFTRILKTAYGMHAARIGRGYGVSERLNYTKKPGKSLEKAVHLGVIPPPTQLPRLPFVRLNSPGFAYRTLLVEPPIFLSKLKRDLQGKVRLVGKTFASRSEIAALSEPIIVNCTGYGSKALFNDRNMRPRKGQLVLLKAQPDLDYLFSGGGSYVFPRQDHVIVGGSDEDDKNDTADPALCDRILNLARDIFDGRALRAKDRESWMLRDK